MKNSMQVFTTVAMTLGFLGVTGWAVYSNHPQAELLVGALIGYAGAGVQYWLGSSEGSSRKTDAQIKEAERRAAPDSPKPPEEAVG